MQTAALPLLDEHSTVVAAPTERAWPALLDTVDGAFSRPVGAAYARVVGCADAAASGPRPLAEGATIPGFRVARAVPGRELVLTGRHRFATYALTFRLEAHGDGSSRLAAETRATFPGLPGRAYRLLLLRTGGHVASVRRLLAGARRRAEQRAG